VRSLCTRTNELTPGHSGSVIHDDLDTGQTQYHDTEETDTQYLDTGQIRCSATITTPGEANISNSASSSNSINLHEREVIEDLEDPSFYVEHVGVRASTEGNRKRVVNV